MDFLSHGQYRKDIFEYYRKKCIRITNFCTFVGLVILLLWILAPLFIKEFRFKKKDGSIMVYRNSVLNLYFSFISISFYEQIYPFIYILESIYTIHTVVEVVLSNVLIMQFCWMLSAQLKTIVSKYESFGYKILDKEIDPEFEETYIEDFKSVFSDNVKLSICIKKFYVFMRPMTVFYIGINFHGLIVLIYMFTLNYFKNGSTLTLTSLKLLITASLALLNLFLFCYFYGYLENQISLINFAMYNCNWTNKNIKFKKMLSMAMILNNRINLRMNVTVQKSVKLEMFTSIIHVSYSIISLLVKKTKNSN
ncbi:uncharacterized protein LOC126895192 [Daktulosphaira vitifoliae]|uniref:uncharacterized protein LOC126895192 n=1 Tax=Daktulosphaira vitifoliae TaxID=58002 RepID=UPI0021AAD571|nr:uncharacterized protein LOC126895192 [Daktulosphaira vitifoliae]